MLDDPVRSSHGCDSLATRSAATASVLCGCRAAGAPRCARPAGSHADRDEATGRSAGCCVKAPVCGLSRRRRASCSIGRAQCDPDVCCHVLRSHHACFYHGSSGYPSSSRAYGSHAETRDDPNQERVSSSHRRAQAIDLCGSESSDTETESESEQTDQPTQKSKKRKRAESADASASVANKRIAIIPLTEQLQAITEPSRFQKATLDAAIQTKAMMRTPSKERSDAMEELLSKLLAAIDTCCWSSKAERSASMSDLLNLISDYLVSQLSKHKSNITQERLLKLSHGMQREQSKWGVFEKAIPALKAHLYKNFVVLPHQTDKFKARVEKAIEIVGGWEAEGRPVCAISEFMEQMEVLREVMTCQFKAWHPRGDPNVHKLTNLLVTKAATFRPSQAHDQRRATLESGGSSAKRPRKPAKRPRKPSPIISLLSEKPRRTRNTRTRTRTLVLIRRRVSS